MDIEQIKINIEEIADNFGIRKQQLKLIEEASELIRSLAMDIAKGKDISEETISEIADVNILINQILYLSNSKDEVKKQIEFKLERTIERIKKGYYK